MTTIELAISGMTCGNCVRHVTRALQETPGVRSAAVDLASGRARVTLDAALPARPEALAAAVAEAGYEARPLA